MSQSCLVFIRIITDNLQSSHLVGGAKIAIVGLALQCMIGKLGKQRRPIIFIHPVMKNLGWPSILHRLDQSPLLHFGGKGERLNMLGKFLLFMFLAMPKVEANGAEEYSPSFVNR